MAPTVTESTLVEIYPWPHFQAVIDGQPAIGAKLFSYLPGTSTPSSTFSDPFLTISNPNPTVLDDQGAATVYLTGPTDLRLFDADDVLIWSVSSYEFSSGVTPVPGAVQIGTSQTTLNAIDGASVLTATGLVPQGYRVLGVVAAITQDFGTSRGLTGLYIGDPVVEDRWGHTTQLTATTGTTQAQFHTGDAPIAAQPYSCLVAADGGRFDNAGALQLTAVWEVFSDAPSVEGVLETGSTSVTLTAQDGERQLTATGLTPEGARVLGVTVTITAAFGTSRGLTGLLIGDSIVNNRFGLLTNLTPTSGTTQESFSVGDQPIAHTAYVLQVAADGGRFDANGELSVVVYWATLLASAP
jgi:hypothetical protein